MKENYYARYFRIGGGYLTNNTCNLDSIYLRYTTGPYIKSLLNTTLVLGII